jgi:hypothetical protein
MHLGQLESARDHLWPRFCFKSEFNMGVILFHWGQLKEIASYYQLVRLVRQAICY